MPWISRDRQSPVLLPHRSSDDRFTPINRLKSKLIVSAEECQKRL